ncbi:hypothetical protein [Vreelandella profundi]|uniref:hypothetical protein n=1 Tax=Vreelandella profundi TaxID=2852117 RepID=UPI001F35299B|nr:hypothetical protein [Halomonas profundi]|tara:strand:- start:590 stop:844 length:255 start_codon:yes stop_codon:yes gene_type:complete
MAFVTVSVDVDVDLDEIDTDELRQELESRGDETGATLQQGYCPIECKNTSQLAEALFEARRNGNDERALELVDRLIYAALGRII